MSDADSRQIRRLRYYCRASAITVICMAVLVLCGWAFHVEMLMSVVPGLVTMKANAALCIGLLGASLWLLLSAESRSPSGSIARSLALAAGALGVATLSQYIFHLNLGIDQLLFRDLKGSLGTSSPGRMAPTTATALIAIAAALILLNRKFPRVPSPSQILSLAAGLIAMLAISGYLYNALALTRLFLYTQVAVHTAIALLLLSSGVFFARPLTGIAADLTSRGSGGVMARRSLPFVFFVPIFLGWIRLQGQYAGWYGTEMGLALYSTANVVVFAVLVWLSARQMNKEYEQRSTAETAIRELNTDLENRVNDRTKSLGLLTERLSLATGIAKVGVWEWDLATNTVNWDATMFSIYGMEETVPMPYEKWSTAVFPDDLPATEAILKKVVEEKRDGSAEFRIRHEDGSQRNVAAAERAVLDAEGNVTRVIGVNIDVTERKRAEEALQKSEAQMTHTAEHDFLTGLPNRMLLNDRVRRAITMAPRSLKKVALLFIDLDGFKHINDSLGHSVGDQLLQSIAKRLVNCVRLSDTVSRQGGDEFVVLLSEVEHAEDPAITARRILRAVAETHSIGEQDLHVTASIGVSVYPDDGPDAETLMKNADTAMYQAKENGRQSYQFFEPAMNARAVERQAIEEGLRRALELNEFMLYYQPKVNLWSGEICGAEASLRWNHPTRGIIPPKQFIPIAEDCGLILPIGRWVVREACRQARIWIGTGLSLSTMAVNISAMEFRQEHFLEGILSILDETGLDPRFLELEITESVLMKNAGSPESIFAALRAKGIQLAVDDFGTGYSSLSYLRKFPITSLKIDQSFIRHISTSPEESGIVTAIINIGRSLNLQVIAEGVETREEMEFLKAHECDEAQGFYFSQPVPPQQFTALLEAALATGGTER